MNCPEFMCSRRWDSLCLFLPLLITEQLYNSFLFRLNKMWLSSNDLSNLQQLMNFTVWEGTGSWCYSLFSDSKSDLAFLVCVTSTIRCFLSHLKTQTFFSPWLISPNILYACKPLPVSSWMINIILIQPISVDLLAPNGKLYFKNPIYIIFKKLTSFANE